MWCLFCVCLIPEASVTPTTEPSVKGDSKLKRLSLKKVDLSTPFSKDKTPSPQVYIFSEIFWFE